MKKLLFRLFVSCLVLAVVAAYLLYRYRPEDFVSGCDMMLGFLGGVFYCAFVSRMYDMPPTRVVLITDVQDDSGRVLRAGVAGTLSRDYELRLLFVVDDGRHATGVEKHWFHKT